MAGDKITIVTSWGPGGWDLYARRFVNSFLAYFPDRCVLRAYYHDHELPDDAPQSDRIEYVDLNTVAGLVEFKKRNADKTGGDPYNFRFDAIKFCNKVWAIDDAWWEAKDWLIWLDADTYATKNIPDEFFDLILTADFVWLDRTDIDYAETSFMAFRSNSDAFDIILRTKTAYNIDDVFEYREWHDGYVFTLAAREIVEEYGISVRNLSEGCKGLDAFHQSPLAEYMTHLKGNKKNGGAPLRIKPVDVEEQAKLEANVRENLTQVDARLKRYLPHERVAVIVGSGPTLATSLPTVRSLYDEGDVIVCAKHALPLLKEAGIDPDYCVVLDPRSVEGESTHGVRRKDLYADVTGVHFLVASMTNPDNVKLLKERGARMTLWHAYTDSLAKSRVYGDEPMIAGGTCAAMRAFGLLYTMGFRRFVVAGVDACRLDEPSKDELGLDSKGRPKWFKVGLKPVPGPDDPTFWTTGELAALAQDVDSLAQRDDLDINVVWLGESLASAMWYATARGETAEYQHGA